MTQLDCAIEQILAARRYSERLLDQFPEADWFRMPSEGVTHVGWQVGHLAVAEYRLGVAFVREAKPDDHTWLPVEYLKLFGRNSEPQPDAGLYPAPQEILATLANAHEHVLAELRGYRDEDLQGPAMLPSPIVKTKMDAVFWCSRHECVHAGQIALLRRLLGLPPQW